LVSIRFACFKFQGFYVFGAVGMGGFGSVTLNSLTLGVFYSLSRFLFVGEIHFAVPHHRQEEKPHPLGFFEFHLRYFMASRCLVRLGFEAFNDALC